MKDTVFYIVINPFNPTEYRALMGTASYFKRESIKAFLKDYAPHVKDWAHARKLGYTCQKSVLKIKH